MIGAHFKKLAQRVGALCDDGMRVFRSRYSDELYVTLRVDDWGDTCYPFSYKLAAEDMPALEADILRLNGELKAFRNRWGSKP